MKKLQSVEEYFSNLPEAAREALSTLRDAVRKAAPQGEEVISYGMPALRWNGILVWYGAHTGHVGLYPRGSGIAAFQAELAPYKTSKGAIQFPFGKPIPVSLVK